MVKFREVRRVQLVKSPLLTTTLVILGSFQIFKVCLVAQERVVCGNNGKLQYQFIPSKTATLVPEFAVEDLPLGRTSALVPEFTMKYVPMGRRLG